MNAMDSAPHKLHPLLTVAAVSVTAASLAAIGVFTGILPSPNATKPEMAVEPVPVVAQLAAAPAPAVAVPAVPAPAVEIEQKPAPVAVPPKPPKPVIKPYKPVTSKPAVHTVAANHVPPPPPVATAHQVPANMPPVPPDYRPATTSVPPPPPPPSCRECGTVEMVREVIVPQPTETPGIGAVAGGILGGVLGHQMGSGRGNDVATVLGAVGGAFAGHQIEKTQRKTVRYEITVRMDDGSLQLLNAEQAPAWRGGERVKVINGTAMPMI